MVRSQLVEVFLDGGPALLRINSSYKSWSKATKKLVLKDFDGKERFAAQMASEQTKGEASYAEFVCAQWPSGTDRAGGIWGGTLSGSPVTARGVMVSSR